LAAADGDLSTTLVASDFNFRIPAGAIIQGVTVEVDRSVLGSIDANKISADDVQLRIGKWWNQSLSLGLLFGQDGSTGQLDRSVDGGLTLAKLGFGELDISGAYLMFATDDTGQYQIVVSNETTNTSPQRGISHSSDYGDSWTWLGDHSATIPETRGFSEPGLHWCDDRFFITGYNGGASPRCWTSTTGLVWTEVSGNILVNTRVNDYFYWPGSGRFYLNADSGGTFSRAGLQTSTGASKGAVWTGVTGTTTTGDWKITYDPGTALGLRCFAASATAMLVIGTIDAAGKLYRTTDTDADPSMSAVTTTGWNSMQCIGFGNAVFLVGTKDGVRKSTNDGASFGSVIDVDGFGSTVMAVQYSVTNSLWVAIVDRGGTSDIFHSTDDGDTWSKIQDVTNSWATSNLYLWDPA